MTDTQLSPDVTTDETAPGGGAAVAAAPAADVTPPSGDGAAGSPGADLRRFRAATYEDALAHARDELGPGVRVVEANRIRRGGLGGFFATDLGIEIAVSVGDEAGAVDDVGGDVRTGNPIEDATGDGALPGQSLGMTDERLLDLLRRAEQRDRSGATSFEHHLERAGRGEASGTADEMHAGDATRRDTVEDERFVPRLPPRSPVAVAPATAAAPDAPSAPIEPPRLPARGPIGAVVRTAPPGFVDGCDVIGDPISLPAAGSETAVISPETAADPVAPDRIVNARPAIAPRAATPTATEDALTRPTRLAAAATDRLMSKLGKLQVADGSKLGDLSRLQVSVTTSDGSRIEMTAELATDGPADRS